MFQKISGNNNQLYRLHADEDPDIPAGVRTFVNDNPSATVSEFARHLKETVRLVNDAEAIRCFKCFVRGKATPAEFGEFFKVLKPHGSPADAGKFLDLFGDVSEFALDRHPAETEQFPGLFGGESHLINSVALGFLKAFKPDAAPTEVGSFFRGFYQSAGTPEIADFYLVYTPTPTVDGVIDCFVGFYETDSSIMNMSHIVEILRTFANNRRNTSRLGNSIPNDIPQNMHTAGKFFRQFNPNATPDQAGNSFRRFTPHATTDQAVQFLKAFNPLTNPTGVGQFVKAFQPSASPIAAICFFKTFNPDATTAQAGQVLTGFNPNATPDQAGSFLNAFTRDVFKRYATIFDAIMFFGAFTPNPAVDEIGQFLKAFAPAATPDQVATFFQTFKPAASRIEAVEFLDALGDMITNEMRTVFLRTYLL